MLKFVKVFLIVLYDCVLKPTKVLFNPIHNACCDLDEEQNPLLSEFRSILEFMKRIPIQKALTDRQLVFRSHIKRFWKHGTYDDQPKQSIQLLSVIM
ncbi:hypothetical protein Hanom_Chr06g00536831 [Helianthus anomalus]